MPLPPAPTRRGSQLSSGALAAKASAKSRKSTGPVIDDVSDLELGLEHTEIAAAEQALERTAAAHTAQAAPAAKPARGKKTGSQKPATSANTPTALKNTTSTCR